MGCSTTIELAGFALYCLVARVSMPCFEGFQCIDALVDAAYDAFRVFLTPNLKLLWYQVANTCNIAYKCITKPTHYMYMYKCHSQT